MLIRSAHTELVPDRDAAEDLQLTATVVEAYGLDAWAARFSLMTAGYRDQMNPGDAASPDSPFNAVTVAIMAEAKARVLRRQLGNEEPADLHVGGEVRSNTQTFIQIAARIYAAHGFRVHLRREVKTTPIWYSSFGVFYSDYLGGDNFTASHSAYFKMGWKVMDGQGKQMTEEEDDIIAEVRRIVSGRETIHLAPWKSSGRILFDFDVDAAYAACQKMVLGDQVLRTIVETARRGLRCAAYTVGGSMAATSRRILKQLEIPPEALTYFLDDEDPRFHRVGEIGKENFGADVGKAEVLANSGAPAKLLSGEAAVVLLWDPDGDRLNIVTTAPVALRSRALEFGLTLGPGDDRNVVVYLTPNQLYLLLVDYRIGLLRKSGLLEKYDWFVGTTFPTAMAIEELAQKEGLPTIRVPVGFRNIGDLCRTLEENMGKPQTFTTLTGQRIPLGAAPRALILCEESGGAALGGPELMRSRSGRQSFLALREKDGMQLALLAWAMAAALHQAGKSMGGQFCDLVEQRGIQYRHSARLDVSLYNEALTGEELKRAKSSGIETRDRVVAFFRDAAAEIARDAKKEESVRGKMSQAGGSAGMMALPAIQRAAWVGDGSLFEMAGARLVVRASGTDAVIRYYIEATSAETFDVLRHFTSGLRL
ncbi:MAG: hypothetical protein LAP21_15380 [Acidobacteriia bacterium]|nr:hypothetical protein [Terriglobia bacterium]